MSMTQVRRGLACLMILLAPSAAFAGGDQVEREIAYLLDKIARSDCRFIRNGKEHSAGEAHAHIQKKYGHAKPAIGTAEDFIRKVATESSISGKPYRIRCSDREAGLAEWLHEALTEFRRPKDPG